MQMKLLQWVVVIGRAEICCICGDSADAFWVGQLTIGICKKCSIPVLIGLLVDAYRNRIPEHLLTEEELKWEKKSLLNSTLGKVTAKFTELVEWSFRTEKEVNAKQLEIAEKEHKKLSIRIKRLKSKNS